MIRAQAPHIELPAHEFAVMLAVESGACQMVAVRAATAHGAADVAHHHWPEFAVVEIKDSEPPPSRRR